MVNGRRYVDFELAKFIARRAGCKSRRQYWEWWEKDGNDGVPKRPDKVYKEWQGWNDFLGTRNTFEPLKKKMYRPFWEAVQWSQRNAKEHGLKTMSDWFQFYKENKDSIPPDIPKRPEVAYNEWQGWPTWLGKTIESKVDSAQNSQGFVALVVEHMNPKNMVSVIKWKDGYVSFVEKVKEKQWYVVKLYENEEGCEQLIRRVMDTYGSNKGGNVWLLSNVNHILFELDTSLMIYRPSNR